MPNQINILLVDDMPANLLTLEAVLEKLELHMVRAYSGKEALEKMEQMEFAVVLLDVQMPGIDGFETAMEMRRREHLRLTPIIFMTAADLGDSAILRGYEEGGADVLLKPFAPEILRSKVRVFVELYRKNRVLQKQTAELAAAREVLQASRDFYLYLFDRFPSLVWRSDTEGQANYFNTTWLRFTGRTLEQEQGMGWVEGLHEEDREKSLSTYKDAHEKRQPLEMEFRLRHVSGEFRWLQNSASPFFNPDGAFAGYIGSCYDITERKNAEAAIRDLNQDLERRVQERTAELQRTIQDLEAFSYSVSHDLRTPLRAINAFSRLLNEDGSDELKPESKRYLGLISEGAVRMGQLIDDLLAFSRLGRQPLEVSRVNMEEVAREVVEECAVEYDGRNVQFNFDNFCDVYADRNLVKHVLQNLVSNALKFTQQQVVAIISLGCTDTKNGVASYVRDNGTGLDMKYSEKIFGVFERLHTPEQYEGTGVGLAIAHRIIHRHGGQIWVESEQGKGASFYFSLPQPS
jgi:PAS domain S-box-containing protein